MFRGVNRCQLFEEAEDYDRLLVTFDKAKTELGFEVYAYALMTNHVHLLFKEMSPGDIITAMRKTLAPYAFWFNRKYERSGALITNRYKSECVTDDAYLLAVVRYIHNNPIKAGLASSLDSYRWSSYRDYLAGRSSFVDIDFTLAMFAADRVEAIRRFEQFHAVGQDDDAIRLPQDRKRNSDGQIRVVLASECDGLEPNAISGLPSTQRDAVLVFLKGQGFSIRQIERVTGVPRGIVGRANLAHSLKT
jgi:REP element-mobilizing transposase RayT